MMTSTPRTETPPSAGFFIGVDVGGTKVAAGVVDATGAIHSQTRKPMVVSGSSAVGLSGVTSAIDALAAMNGNAAGNLLGIGICAPGPLDPATGVVVNPPNLPCWRNFPLAEEIGNIYHVPVRVDNDGNSAALAETLWGAGRGYKYVFYAGIGTGIGTGIVLDGKIYHGRTGAAGEGGHCSIDYRGPRCACGKPGCIEAYASGPSIARRARAKVVSGGSSKSAMLELAGGNPDALTTAMVGQAHAAGDDAAKLVLEETVEVLTLWFSNIVDLLDPDVLIVGGGVSVMLRPFFQAIRERLPEVSVNPRCREIPFLPALYGEDSGIAGGAALSSLPKEAVPILP